VIVAELTNRIRGSRTLLEMRATTRIDEAALFCIGPVFTVVYPREGSPSAIASA